MATGKTLLSRKSNPTLTRPGAAPVPVVGERGNKPYIDIEEKGQSVSYIKKIRATPKRQIFDIRPERDSEFVKPYRDATNYNGMEHYYHSNFRKPYSDAGAGEIPIVDTKDDEVPCEGSLARAVSIPSKVLCGGGTASLRMEGHDGNGNPWVQADITWAIVFKDLDCGSIVGIKGGAFYKAPKCDEFTGLDLCFGCSATIRGTTPCGNWSTTIVQVDPDPSKIITVTGDGDVTEGSCYSSNGGKGTINWSISCGEIAHNGCVTDLTACCGILTISATDECNNVGTLEVRGPNSEWVEQSDTTHCPGLAPTNCTIVSGGIRTKYHVTFCGYNIDPEICPSACGPGADCCAHTCIEGNPCNRSPSGPGSCRKINRTIISTWECL